MTAQNEKGVVILGSTSGIARAAAIEFGRHGYNLVLAARDQEENEIIATDLRVRCDVSAVALPFEATDYESHARFVEQCSSLLGDSMDGVVLCFGYLDEQAKAQADFEIARRTIDLNYLAAVSILEHFARHFETRGAGFIAGVTSVAGDRGRQSNYLYGSAKAAMNAYLQGLRNRLHHAGRNNVPAPGLLGKIKAFRARSAVTVTTIKPGPTDTKMTFALTHLSNMATPEQVGKDIYHGVTRGASIVYTPWIWRYVMLIVRHIPECVFKRLKM